MTDEIKIIRNKIKKYVLIEIIILVIAIIFFILFLYFAYVFKKDGEHTPITLLASISLFITYALIRNKNKTIKNYLNKIEFEYSYNKIKKANEEYLTQMQNQSKINKQKTSKYHIKAKTITDNEKYFLNIIKKHFSENYEIRPQVPLASIIEKDKEFENQYQNELNRIIDIGIFNKKSSYPLLLIEINDNTHKRKDRQVRDAKVKNICEQAGIKLIAFWTEYSNTEEYIFNRINDILRDSN